MTHFIGAVVIPSHVPFTMLTSGTKYPSLYGADALENTPGKMLDDYLNEALARFDENMRVERWVPKSELIAKSRENIEAYRTGTYAEYIADPAKYAEGVSNLKHLDYLANEFPKKLQWTDEEVYADIIKHEEPEDIREDGAVRDTYNPDSQWDWWTIGGRWEKTYRERQGEKISDFRAELVAALEAARVPENIAAIADISARIDQLYVTMRTQGPDAEPRVTWQDTDALETERTKLPGYFPWWTPYNVVVPSETINEESSEHKYEWVTKGRMGWWGMKTDDMTNEQWVEQLIATLDKQDPEARIVYIDFHI